MIYNKPVTVGGTPRLAFALDSANDTVLSDSYAYYEPSFDIGRYGRGRCMRTLFALESMCEPCT